MIVETQPPQLTTQLVTACDAETLSVIAATVFRDAYRSAFESDQQVEEFIAKNLSPRELRSEIESRQKWYLLGLVDGKDRIWSAEAKATWIDPDLKPLDF